MNEATKNTIKGLLPTLIFILFLIPVITSSLLDLEQKREVARVLEQERLAKEAEQRTYLMGHFDQTTREDFVQIPPEYIMGPNKMYLRQETFDAYIEMYTAAIAEGIRLKVASATRNFDYQAEIWNNKWSGSRIVDGMDLSVSFPDGVERFKKILEYSAVPGASRHHWGTEIDINGADPIYFNTEKGMAEYDWMVKNAQKFGFCQTYNLKGSSRPTGYNEEKWHWSYLPLSRDFTKQYKNLIRNENIKGFLGDEYAPKLNIIKDYVVSINPECL